MSFDILCQPGDSLQGNFLPSAADADELGAALDRNQESLNGEPQERRAPRTASRRMVRSLSVCSRT